MNTTAQTLEESDRMHAAAPNLASLFRRALEIAAASGDAAIHTRGRIARAAQRSGVAAALGGLVEEADAASDARARQDLAATPDRLAVHDRLMAAERTARRLALDGDVPGAEEAYLSVEDARDSYDQRGLVGAHVTVMGWLLEAGDLARSLDLFRNADWEHPYTRLAIAQKIAEALNAAGRRPEALDLLRGLRVAPDATDAPEALSWLGQALWAVGETREGVAILREAARASLAHAARQGFAPLRGYDGSQPITLAQIQCVVGDREGAADTLDGVLRFATAARSPLTGHPGPPRGKPEGRWFTALPNLVRVLAQAGLDEAAASLIASAGTGQLRLLRELARGRGRRGAYAEAFGTVEHMRTVEATERERADAMRDSLDCIRGYAAGTGDAETFRYADRLLRELPGPPPLPGRDFLHLKLAVHRGEAEAALAAIARATGESERLTSLSALADFLAEAQQPARKAALRYSAA